MAGMAPPYPKPKQQPQMIRVVDLETTGSAPPAHGVCEIGWQDVALGEDGRWEIYGEGGSILVNPGRLIPPVTQAIHHILDEQVADAPYWHDCARQVLDPWAAPPRAGCAPRRFRAKILHVCADPGCRVDLHLEMRAPPLAR